MSVERETALASLRNRFPRVAREPDTDTSVRTVAQLHRTAVTAPMTDIIGLECSCGEYLPVGYRPTIRQITSIRYRHLLEHKTEGRK